MPQRRGRRGGGAQPGSRGGPRRGLRRPRGLAATLRPRHHAAGDGRGERLWPPARVLRLPSGRADLRALARLRRGGVLRIHEPAVAKPRRHLLLPLLRASTPHTIGTAPLPTHARNIQFDAAAAFATALSSSPLRQPAEPLPRGAMQNFRTYNRTADVNRLVFEGIELSADAARQPQPQQPQQPPRLWSELFSTDYPREQTWSRGDKGSCCCWFSLMSHYNARIPESAWQRGSPTAAAAAPPSSGGGVRGDEDRPVVWLATSNHMMAERNLNSHINFPGGWRAWSMEDYDPHLGTRACAEAWAQSEVPVKTNFFSCCCWKVQRPTPTLTALDAEAGHGIATAATAASGAGAGAARRGGGSAAAVGEGEGVTQRLV